MSRITVRIVPNASRSEIIGKEWAAWKIRIASPPIEGKANDALIELLSDVLDIPRSTIEIVKGQSSKIKLVDVGLGSADADDMLTRAIGSDLLD